jgi:molybdopterin/thiamine biosynthesis adenylyltransferase
MNHKAEIFRMKNREDRVRLDRFQGQERAMEMLDTLEDQLAELVVTRQPALRMNPSGVADAVAKEIGPTGWEEYGVWVWFSWSNTLVRLLDEPEFVELRTNRNRDRIRTSEQDELGRKMVGVVGLSVGQAFALTLAMERGAGVIRIADYDELELSNLNRIQAGVASLGLPKWLITARRIAEVDPYLEVEVWPEGVKAHNVNAFCSGLDLVCDACDDISTKALLRMAAKAKRIPLLMETSDRGMLDVERYDDPKLDGYLHGRIDELTMERLSRHTGGWDGPTLDLFVNLEEASDRGIESLSQLGTTLTAWPQLFSEVAAGGAFAAQVCRRLLLGESLPDCRIYLELDGQLAQSIA